jgi:hypothetical protein
VEPRFPLLCDDLDRVLQPIDLNILHQSRNDSPLT